MSLDLTKAPWPEWEKAEHDRGAGWRALDYLEKAEYAFARHRVNLHEELVRELGEILDYLDQEVAVFEEKPEQTPKMRDLRKLLARAKAKPE